ncbi:MAG: DMT family transporter [Bdellovibrionota bacterium]
MNSYLGLSAAFTSSLTWAVGVIAFTPFSKKHPAYIINLHRILLGLPAFLIVLLLQGRLWSAASLINSTNASWAAVAVLASYAFGDVLFLMATKRLGAPAALAIASTYPVFSALEAMVFRGESLPFAKYVGIAIVIIGTIFVILSGSTSHEPVPSVARMQDNAYARSRFTNDHRSGVLLAFGCAICWAMNTVAISEVGQSLDAITLNAFRLMIALVLCPLIGITMHGTKSFKLISRKEFVPVIPIFAVEAIGGPFFYVYGLSHAPLAIGAALTSLAPVLTVPLALALGQEKFSWTRTLGVITVVAGIWVMVF